MSEAGFNKSFHTLLKISIICIFLLANIGFGLLTVDSSESQPTSPYGFTVRSDYPVLNGPGAIFVADIDADSDLDIITSNKYNNTISIRKNNGSGIFNTTSNYYVSDSPMGLQITDLGEDGNNDLDIMVCGYDANKVTILFNNGTGGFDDSVNYEIEDSKDPGPVDLYAADIDNDGDQDLAVCNHWAHSISIFKNKGNGIFSKNVNYEVNDRPYSVFLADIDQDQYSDLITVHYLDSAISVLINDGTGKFGNGFNLPVDAGPHDVWVTDIDNDADNDIITANQFANNVSVLKNIGSGNFAPMVTYPVGQNPLSVFLGNADNDSDPDILTANVKSNSISTLYNNGDGTFGGLMNWTVGTSPYDVALGDFNLDGLADLAAANFGSDSVTVLLNNYIPTLNIYQPDGVGDRADTFYKIKWVGADLNPDEILAIDLYYVNYSIIDNTTYELKTPIILGTNNDGIYTWNTTDVVEGNYSIYGEIKDDRGGVGSNYSIGNVSIYHNMHPEIVVLTPPVEGAEADTSYTIQWIDQDLDDDALINLYKDIDRIYNNGNEQVIIKGLSEDNEEDEYNWNTENETEGEFYILAEIYDNWGVENYNYSQGRLKIDHNVQNNTAPDITLLEPDGIDDKIDGSYFITWWDHDPDDNAEISLYYDVDNIDLDGLKIVDNLSEDSKINKFHWSTSNIPNGSYYIYAKIDDNINAPVFNYSSGPLNVSHNAQNIRPWISIVEPDGTDDDADLDFEIKWKDSDSDDNAEILMYYNTEKELFDGVNIVKGLEEDDEDNSYLWDTSEIPGGKYYIYAMIFDFVNEPIFNISNGHVLVDHNKPPMHTNSPPTLEILEPDGKDDLANISYLIQWIDDDPEDDAIITLFYDRDNIGFDGDIIINKLSEDGELDHYLWNTTGIQDGSYYVYGIISDSFNAPFSVYSIGNLTISHNFSEDEPPVIVDIDVKAVISTPLPSKTYLTSDRIIFDGSQSRGVDLTYNWYSSIEGDIGHQRVFTKNLSAGEHTITLEVRDRNSQISIVEIIVPVEEPRSKDRDHAPDLIASVAFLLIFIITIIIFLILIRKRVEKPEPEKTKKARDTKNQKKAAGSKRMKKVEMRKK